MALQSNSPAINIGDNASAVDESGNPLTTDARGTGFDRQTGCAVDLGAYETSDILTSCTYPPNAVDDAFTTDEDTALSGNLLNDNGNGADDDIDSATFTVTSIGGQAIIGETQITLPSNAVITVNTDGSITYDPASAFDSLAIGDSDTDSFDYTITDDQSLTDTATVTVTITGVNDAPVANDDTAATDEETGVTVDVLANDTDADNNDTFTIDSFTQASNGTVTQNSETLIYTPNTDFAGEDTFTYTVIDSNNAMSNTATVTVTVNNINDDPIAVDDDVNTLEDVAITIDVLANDIDVDTNDIISIDSFTQPNNGAVTQNNNQLIYTPSLEFSGEDTFTYTIRDNVGANPSTATVTVTVAFVNDDPVANMDEITIPINSNPVIVDVLANDTDAEGDELTITTVMVDVFFPAEVEATITPDGKAIEITPIGTITGPAGVMYEISDGNGGTATGGLHVLVHEAEDVNGDFDLTPVDAMLVINRVGQTVDASNDFADVDKDGDIDNDDVQQVVDAIEAAFIADNE